MCAGELGSKSHHLHQFLRLLVRGSTLLLNALNRVDDTTRARASAVQAAWTLGVITSEEARAKHGVVLWARPIS